MPDSNPPPRVSIFGVVVSLVVLCALVVFTILHASDARHFVGLVERAEPLWIVAALGLQVGTYACAGGIWKGVARSTGPRLNLLALARLSIERLSINQLVPTGGVAGNLVVAASMHRLGLPAAAAAEALLIDFLAYYAAYASVAAAALVSLWWHHDVGALGLGLLAACTCVLAVLPLSIDWLVRHREWSPGSWLARVRALERVRAAVAGVSIERLRDPKLLVLAAALHLATFLLDAGTLWMLLRATGTHASLLTAFTAFVVASLAGTFSLLPGGLGSFEAGCTATLALLGVPVEAALTGTLLLRGLTLWLPLVPGAVLARRDLAGRRREVGASTRDDIEGG